MLTYYNYIGIVLYINLPKNNVISQRESAVLVAEVLNNLIFVFATERPCTKLFYIRGIKGKVSAFYKI